MKKLIGLGMMAIPLAASPALARDGQAYMQIDGGLLMARDGPVAIDFGLPAPLSYDPGIGYSNGYDVGGAIGYDFGKIRIEAELAYKRAKVNGLESNLIRDIGFGGGNQEFAEGGNGPLALVGGAGNPLQPRSRFLMTAMAVSPGRQLPASATKSATPSNWASKPAISMPGSGITAAFSAIRCRPSSVRSACWEA